MDSSEDKGATTKLEVPQMSFDETVGKGKYANVVAVSITEHEAVLDFGFRGGIPSMRGGQMVGGHNFHVARIVTSVNVARDLHRILQPFFEKEEESTDA